MAHDSKKTFVDTGVLSYVYSKDEPEKQERVISALESEIVVTSTQVINELTWFMNTAHGVDLHRIHIIVDSLFDIFEVVQTTKKTMDKSFVLCHDLKCSYWKALALSSALEAGCSFCYTEEFQNGLVVENELKIVNPFL